MPRGLAAADAEGADELVLGRGRRACPPRRRPRSSRPGRSGGSGARESGPAPRGRSGTSPRRPRPAPRARRGPVARAASPTASAVVTATQPVWTIASSRVSSKSRPWASVPLASTALAAATRVAAADHRALGRAAEAARDLRDRPAEVLARGGQRVAQRVEQEVHGLAHDGVGNARERQVEDEAGQVPGSGRAASARLLPCRLARHPGGSVCPLSRIRLLVRRMPAVRPARHYSLASRHHSRRSLPRWAHSPSLSSTAHGRRQGEAEGPSKVRAVPGSGE